ncbi:MAG: hypothetical protein SH847_16555 [Roseiflexaceae bacterium]|nr:hypothetical protein [Roseiflexaceae bacterium]
MRDIEQELDTRLQHLRARMVEDSALASATTDWREPTTPHLFALIVVNRSFSAAATPASSVSTVRWCP